MARPLRVDVENGWYHVTSRGIERRSIFGNEREHAHFLELLEAMVDRFRVVLHAHVELDNHYHLIVQTPDANLSRAIQWLNVSYSVSVNRRRGRVGPLMQGRFKSIPVEGSCQNPTAGVQGEKLHQSFWAFVATPLRAIADLLYLNRTITWQKDGPDFLMNSLRIEDEDLREISFDRCDEIVQAFRSRRVNRYLEQMQREYGHD